MVIFHSYVSLPEGILIPTDHPIFDGCWLNHRPGFSPKPVCTVKFQRYSAACTGAAALRMLSGENPPVGFDKMWVCLKTSENLDVPVVPMCTSYSNGLSSVFLPLKWVCLKIG